MTDKEIDRMVTKKRHAYGERNGTAKISAQDVDEIKRLFGSRWTIQRIAQKFGLSTTHVRGILSGES